MNSRLKILLLRFVRFFGTIKGNFVLGFFFLMLSSISFLILDKYNQTKLNIISKNTEINFLEDKNTSDLELLQDYKEEYEKARNTETDDNILSTLIQRNRELEEKIVKQQESINQQRQSVTEEIQKFESSWDFWLSRETIDNLKFLLGIFSPLAILFLFSVFFRLIVIIAGIPFRNATLLIEKQRANIASEDTTEQSKAKPAWDKAQLILEKYYDRNLAQVNQIFVLSVVVMTAGFILISVPVVFPNRFLLLQNIIESEKLEGSDSSNQTQNSDSDSPNQFMLLTVISGVITEFIGATFLIIYRSTINQAIRYTESLERVNSVGMAIQIVDLATTQADKESDAAQKKLLEARIEIAKLLLERANKISDSSKDNNEKS